MSFILETLVTTRSADGSAHLAPLGIREQHGLVLLAPFRPSRTLDNLERDRCAVVNMTDDVRIFAGCLTGRRDWPVRAATKIPGFVLKAALAHRELEVARHEDDELRPRFYLREVHAANHAPFSGFNRAQGAVIEAAILVSRLPMLPPDKVERELDYLRIAIDKTAGPREREAWNWLSAQISAFRAGR